MKKIAVFASGSGSNMQKIAEYFRDHFPEQLEIGSLITDQKDAYVQVRAKAFGVPTHYLTAEDLRTPEVLLPLLKRYHVEAIVLAGYLRLVPPFLLQAYPERIVNIHPALLPKYGGKGMYGMHVHKAVKVAGESESGITIHIIDEDYDRGTTLFQAKVALEPDDTPETIAQKVQKLEHAYFAPVVAKWLLALPTFVSPK